MGGELRVSGRGRDFTVARWTPGPSEPGDGAVHVSLTDFEVARARDLVGVYRTGLRLRRAWPTMPGALGVWLWAKPFERRSGAVSVWRDEADLRAFVGWPPHVAIMRAYRDRGTLVATGWSAERFRAASIWSDAEHRLSRAHPVAAARGGPRGYARRRLRRG
jgi:heme-degrading monooxygenase HmoA